MRQAKGAGIIRSVVYQTVNGKAGEGWEIGRWGAARRGPSHSLFMCSIIILYFGGGKTVQGNRQLCDEPALNVFLVTVTVNPLVQGDPYDQCGHVKVPIYCDFGRTMLDFTVDAHGSGGCSSSPCVMAIDSLRSHATRIECKHG